MSIGDLSSCSGFGPSYAGLAAEAAARLAGDAGLLELLNGKADTTTLNGYALLSGANFAGDVNSANMATGTMEVGGFMLFNGSEFQYGAEGGAVAHKQALELPTNTDSITEIRITAGDELELVKDGITFYLPLYRRA